MHYSLLGLIIFDEVMILAMVAISRTKARVAEMEDASPDGPGEVRRTAHSVTGHEGSTPSPRSNLPTCVRRVPASVGQSSPAIDSGRVDVNPNAGHIPAFPKGRW